MIGDGVNVCGVCGQGFVCRANSRTDGEADPVALGALSRTQDRMGWDHENGSQHG